MTNYYNIYRNMRQIVFNPNNRTHRHIEDLTLEWPTYREFLAWALKHLGPKPGPEYECSRRDLKGGYTSDNLVWRSHQEVIDSYYAQCHTNLTYRRRPVSMKTYCEIKNLDYDKFTKLRRRGQTDLKTLTRLCRR